MATYAGLGPRRASGTSQDNINWTVTFDPDVFLVSDSIPFFEVYKIVVNAVASSVFTVFIESYQWDANLFGESNAWDPNEPMLLQPGQTVYFYYTYSSANVSPPTVTLWLRYDKSLLNVRS